MVNYNARYNSSISGMSLHFSSKVEVVMYCKTCEVLAWFLWKLNVVSIKWEIKTYNFENLFVLFMWHFVYVLLTYIFIIL